MFNRNAEQYAKFNRERTLPASDPANAIECDNVRSVPGIGCGIGNSTAVPAEKFPRARIVGSDNSDDMLAAARKVHYRVYPRRNGIPAHFILVDTLRKAKSLPCVFNNLAVLWGGKFVTVNRLDSMSIDKILKQNLT